MSADTPEGCAALAAASHPSVEVYRDPDARWIRAIDRFDVEEAGRLAARPAMFAVDRVGQIRYRYLSRDAGDRPTTALVLLAAEAVSRLT